MNPNIAKIIENINKGIIPEGYKKTKVGIVPVEWDVIKAKEVFVNITNKKHGGQLEILSATQNRGIIPRSQVDIDIKYEKENTLNYKKVEKGNFVISLRSFQGGIEYSEYEGIVSPAYTVLSSKVEICNNYYKVFFKSLEYIQRLNTAVYGIRDGKNISYDDFSLIYIPFPPLPEQQKIAEILSTQDKLIELYERKIEQLKTLKKGYLQKMFPKKGCKYPELRFKGFTEPWEQRKLGEIGQTYTGLSGKTKEDFGHGKAKFVTYMNVFSNPVAEISMTEPIEIDKRQNEIKYGDVFFTTSSETPEEVGMSSVWLENGDNTYLNSFCFGYRPIENINPFYMAYMLRSESVRKKITFLAQGISRYNISKNKMMEISIPLSKIEEQKKIGDYFRNLDRLITLHQHKLDKEKQKKKALMQLLLTGKVRVST